MPSRISGPASLLTTFWRRSLAKTEWAVREDSPSTTAPVAASLWLPWFPYGVTWLAGLDDAMVAGAVDDAARDGAAEAEGSWVLSSSSNRTTPSSRRSMWSIFFSLVCSWMFEPSPGRRRHAKRLTTDVSRECGCVFLAVWPRHGCILSWLAHTGHKGIPGCSGSMPSVPGFGPNGRATAHRRPTLRTRQLSHCRETWSAAVKVMAQKHEGDLDLPPWGQGSGRAMWTAATRLRPPRAPS